MISKQEALPDVKVQTLPRQVAAHLVRQIATAQPDDVRVPSELDITQQFGVSRVVARETLKILSSLDIVHVAQGRRVQLRPPEEWDYLNIQLLQWLPEELVTELLRELQETRLLLEPELAAKAAELADQETLQALADLLRRMEESEDSPEAYLELDIAFHLEICRASKNRILDRIMYSARWLLATSRRVTNDQPHGLAAATEVHTEIYNAIAAGDPAAAREAMRDHMQRNVKIMTEKNSGAAKKKPRRKSTTSTNRRQGRESAR